MKTSLAALGVVFFFLIGAAAPAAQAGERPGCGYDYVTPFSLWGDDDLYGLAPSGSFEEGASGWELSGGAIVAAPGSGLLLGSQLFSLFLPAGSSVTSPPICVQAGSPKARVFALTNVGSAAKRTLKVTITYTDRITGRQTTRSVATLAEQAAWAPSRRLPLGGPKSVKPGADGRKTVQYAFTPLHGTSWSIDDLYIDPKRR